MVEAPFKNIIQQEQTAKRAGSDLPSLRQELRNAMDWGRWSWFTKLAEAARPKRLPSLLQKAAIGATDAGGQYYPGWYLPNEFLNSPLRGGGTGLAMPGSPVTFNS
jgi:hypothetical protein